MATVEQMGNGYLFKIFNYKELLHETSNSILTLDRYDYNCGGFALGTFDWYVPSSYEEDYDNETIEQIEVTDIRQEYYNSRLDHYDACDEIANYFIKNMCNDLIGVREIEAESELKENEYLVAFKAAIDDFHYARRLSNGRWFHKMGSCEITEIQETQVYDDTWWLRMTCGYNGRLRLLAVQYK